jgi:hypothetical protein
MASTSIEARMTCLSRILQPKTSNGFYYHSPDKPLTFCSELGQDYFFSIEVRCLDLPAHQMETLCTLGAPALEKYLESDNRRQYELITSSYNVCSEGLARALWWSDPVGQLFDLERDSDLWNDLKTFRRDSLNQPNRAWLWAKENKSSVIGSSALPHDRDLRAWGYVFWDSERLQKLRFIEQPRPELGANSDPPPPMPLEHGHPLSAEQKLMDMGLL